MSEAEFNILCPYQIDWIGDTSPFSLWRKSRRIGATWAHALGVVLRRKEGRSNYYHSSADMTAAVEFIDYCSDWCDVVKAVARVSDETEEVDDVKITTKVITFSNGTKIVAGSSNPKFFRSKGGEVGLDEIEFHADQAEMFKAAHATALFWGHPLRAWSSCNGEGSYTDGLIERALATPPKLKARVHQTTIRDAVMQGIVERIRMRKEKLNDIPAPDAKLRQEWLDELRSTCPDDDTWAEEYMCVPSASGRKFLPSDLLRSCVEANLQPIRSLDGWQDRTFNGPLYAGYDVGRTQDLSVLWVLEKVGDVFWTRVLIELKATDYTTQFNVLRTCMENPAVKRLCIDKGLIGGMLAEMMEQRFGQYRVEGIQFTIPVMSELAMPIRAAFEDRSIRIPDDVPLLEDLRKPKKIVVANHVRFESPRDEHGHCDRFWALGLALNAADRLHLPLPAPMMEKPVGW